jgi:hypothetical protein
MKKLIAILVVFGLLTTAVFAQADFSAGGATKTTLIEGHTEADDPWTGFASWFWMSAGKTNEDNTMGAKGAISFSTGDDEDGSSLNVSGDDTWFYAWWQPIDQLFIKMGKIGEDGKHWAGADMMGWGFESNDMLVGIDFDYYNGFAGHLLGDGFAFFDDGLSNHNGLQISILPMDGLAINFGFNMEGLAEEAFVDNIALQVVYQIPDLGEAAIGFRNGAEGEDKNVWLQYSMPISNMKIEAGLQFTLREDIDPILGVGLGFRYGNQWGDQFWATARLAIKYDLESKDMVFGIGVCPSYDLEMFRIYVPINIAMDMPDGGDSVMYWGINPYIRRQMGGLEVWAGFYAHNGHRWPWMAEWPPYDKAPEDVVNWGIPVGFLWAW